MVCGVFKPPKMRYCRSFLVLTLDKFLPKADYLLGESDNLLNKYTVYLYVYIVLNKR